jgi:hypothetical protein
MNFALAATLITAAITSTAALADPPARGHEQHQRGNAAQAKTCEHGGNSMQGMHGHGHHQRMAAHSGEQRSPDAHGQHGAQPGNAGMGCPMHEPAKNT